MKNSAYWDPGTPSIDRVVLLPLPEANSRTAALMSGQVDWIEAPRPTRWTLKAGVKVYSTCSPTLALAVSFVGSPWLDKRAPAANLCVDRASMKQLLGGMPSRPPASSNPATPGAAPQLPDQVRRGRRQP